MDDHISMPILVKIMLHFSIDFGIIKSKNCELLQKLPNRIQGDADLGILHCSLYTKEQIDDNFQPQKPP